MDNKDFEKIYEQYYRPLMLYALSLTKNKHDAEDLAADTFIKAFISYNGSGNIVGWLMTVMKHLFIDDFRRKSRYIDDGEGVLEWVASAENILDNYISNERQRWIYSEIYKLPQTEREIMILTAAGSMDDGQIARLVGISAAHVRVVRHRVRKKLLETAKREGYL